MIESLPLQPASFLDIESALEAGFSPEDISDVGRVKSSLMTAKVFLFERADKFYAYFSFRSSRNKLIKDFGRGRAQKIINSHLIVLGAS